LPRRRGSRAPTTPPHPFQRPASSRDLARKDSSVCWGDSACARPQPFVVRVPTALQPARLSSSTDPKAGVDSAAWPTHLLEIFGDFHLQFFEGLAHHRNDLLALTCARDLPSARQNCLAIGAHDAQVPPSATLEVERPTLMRLVCWRSAAVVGVECGGREELLRSSRDSRIGKDLACLAASVSSGPLNKVREHGLSSLFALVESLVDVAVRALEVNVVDGSELHRVVGGRFGSRHSGRWFGSHYGGRCHRRSCALGWRRTRRARRAAREE